MIYEYDNIREVHLEITDKCNASCPMCARNKNGGAVNQHLPLTEITLSDCKKIFPISFIKQLNKMFMCGNYGDPIIAAETLECYEYFRQNNNNIELGMNTNGSARTPEWWIKLAKVIGNKGYVIFSLDGLEDTNHIYRRGTHWLKIMENVQAFISAGGIARWDFIIFKHNEHQIDEAQKLSNKLGFQEFRTKKTGRFFSDNKLKGKERHAVYNKNGTVEYYLEKPINVNWHNNSLQKEKSLIEKFGNMKEYLNQTPIDCKVIKGKSVYVSAEGLVFPCCWTANQLYTWMEKETQIVKLLNSFGGTENINAKNFSIREIVEGEFFEKIQDSWLINTIEHGKLKVCAKTCGIDFDQFSDQYK